MKHIESGENISQPEGDEDLKKIRQDAFITILGKRLIKARTIEDETERNEKLISAYYDAAKWQLHERWGIDSLSNIEAVRLHLIVKDCFFQDLDEARKSEDLGATWAFDIDTEAAARWLYELYGIDKNDIPYIHVLNDDTDGQMYTVHDRELEKTKKDELTKKGHNVWIDIIIPDDFKEYLKRLREKSHVL